MDYPYKINLRFPGNLEYIPSIRKFVYDILQLSGFSNKFAFRSEIIVDEICNNAVCYGCESNDSEIEFCCEIHYDRIEVVIKDEGGNPLHIDRLKNAVKQYRPGVKVLESGLGLNLVRMLSEKVEFDIDEQNLTSVHITRKREITGDNTTRRKKS